MIEGDVFASKKLVVAQSSAPFHLIFCVQGARVPASMYAPAVLDVSEVVEFHAALGRWLAQPENQTTLPRCESRTASGYQCVKRTAHVGDHGDGRVVWDRENVRVAK